MTYSTPGPLRNVAPKFAARVARQRQMTELKIMLVIHNAIVKGTITQHSPYAGWTPARFYRQFVRPLLQEVAT